MVRARSDRLTHTRNRRRELGGTSGRFSQPERDGRFCAVRIFHPDLPAADMPDAPGLRAEQEYVAGEALNREILVDGADGLALRLDNYRVGRRLRDRASRSDGGEPCAAPAA